MCHSRHKCKCSARNLPEPELPPYELFQTSGNAILPTGVIIPAKLAVITKGNPNNPMALCIPGNVDGFFSFRFLMDHLVNKGYYFVSLTERGNSPSETPLQPLPPLGTAILYSIQDVLEIALSKGLGNNPHNDGKNIMLGNDFGAIIMQVLDGNVFPIFFPNRKIIKKMVSTANIAPLPMIFELQVNGPPFEFLQAQWYQNFANISTNRLNTATTSSNAFEQDLSIEIYKPGRGGIATFKDVLKKQFAGKANKKDFEYEWENNWKPGVYDNFVNNITIGNTFYTDLYAGPYPEVTQPGNTVTKALYVYGTKDGAVPWIQAFGKKEVIKRTKNPFNTPAGADVYIIDCAGHFPLLLSTNEINPVILKFVGNA